MTPPSPAGVSFCYCVRGGQEERRANESGKEERRGRGATPPLYWERPRGSAGLGKFPFVRCVCLRVAGRARHPVGRAVEPAAQVDRLAARTAEGELGPVGPF